MNTGNLPDAIIAAPSDEIEIRTARCFYRS